MSGFVIGTAPFFTLEVVLGSHALAFLVFGLFSGFLGFFLGGLYWILAIKEKTNIQCRT